jgi:molecular chaperone HtpG
MSDTTQTNEFEFKTEIKQLLEIITHSLYTSREIFVRELVSNASDALDKLRFETARGTEVTDEDLPLEIRISTDKDNKILTITDSGIGMTRDELVENIGTIAKSGSAEFIRQAMADKENSSNIIGRFGVGFYSVFMAATKVIITTRSMTGDAAPIRWESDGLGTYRIEELSEDVKRGTSMEIHLKDDADEFADPDRIKSVIKKHSNFITFPIFVGEDKVNTIPALWREPKFSITKEQYKEFYEFLTYDSKDPLDTLHFSVDAPVQFSSLVFIPEQSYDFLGHDRDDYGLDLYVRRVLIQSKYKDLIPQYLGFLKGVVDTEDLPLNISRETLQENLLINKISSTLTKQVLNRLKKLAEEEPETYATFWNTHSKTFKLGYSDFANKDRFAELLRFNSSAHEDKTGLRSLDEYIANAKEDQKEIYYISGPSREAVSLNPHLEIFRKKGIEVLYLYEPIDEFVMDSLGTYKEFTFKATEHADLEALGKYEDKDEEEKVQELSEEEAKDFPGFLERIKTILGDRAEDVRVSKRLSASPACLVSPDGGISSQMQKMMQMITKDTSIPKKVFEVNQDHPLIRNLFRIFKADAEDAYLTQTVEQLYESSLLLDGYLSDPHEMVGRINELLEKSSGWYTEINKI